ncbi:hypothetical protein [Kineobactrum salinum]|uniref:hypothetical protein n=1 Tax=Kineobactrum salinum TaxID=2708301 RepID=UPI001E332877|nr:hypothetical protein [Kineobactrum salinum]
MRAETTGVQRLTIGKCDLAFGLHVVTEQVGLPAPAKIQARVPCGFHGLVGRVACSACFQGYVRNTHIQQTLDTEVGADTDRFALVDNLRTQIQEASIGQGETDVPLHVDGLATAIKVFAHLDTNGAALTGISQRQVNHTGDGI